MKLEIGKTYIMKNGMKVGPMFTYDWSDRFRGRQESGIYHQIWDEDGTVYLCGEGEEDQAIVAEAFTWRLYSPEHKMDRSAYEYSYSNDGMPVAFREKPTIEVAQRIDAYLYEGTHLAVDYGSVLENATLSGHTKDGKPVGTWTIEFDQK